MDALKALADANLKISEAKNTLFKLEETETEYLVLREKKAMDKIQTMIDDSADLLEKTHNNYEEVRRFYETITTYSEVLEQFHQQFTGMLIEFNKRSDMWDTKVVEQQEKIAALRKIVETDQKNITSQQEKIEKDKKEIIVDRARLESQQQTLLASRENLKNLWEKNK